MLQFSGSSYLNHGLGSLSVVRVFVLKDKGVKKLTGISMESEQYR